MVKILKCFEGWKRTLCFFKDMVWLLCRWSQLWGRYGTRSTLCAHSARRSWGAATSSRRTDGRIARTTTSPFSLRTAPTATSPSSTWESYMCTRSHTSRAIVTFKSPLVFFRKWSRLWIKTGTRSVFAVWSAVARLERKVMSCTSCVALTHRCLNFSDADKVWHKTHLVLGFNNHQNVAVVC